MNLQKDFCKASVFSSSTAMTWEVTAAYWTGANSTAIPQASLPLFVTWRKEGQEAVNKTALVSPFVLPGRHTKHLFDLLTSLARI